MMLYLVQHGEAKQKTEDPERSLTDDGANAAERVAARLAAAAVEVNEIRHSGKRRAEQTAAIFARHLAPARGVAVASGLDPKDEIGPLADELRDYHGALMIVGHLPFLSRLAGFLMTGDAQREVIRFRNAGVVCLADDGGAWHLEWAVVPMLV